MEQESWCSKKVAELHKVADRTTVLIVDKPWLDSMGESVVGAHCQGKPFLDDLNMNKIFWFYHAVSH
jgi:hypothetical protein